MKSKIINYNVNLPFGSGDYQVKIHTSTSDNKDNLCYEMINSIKVKNKDTRDMRFLMPDTNVQSDSEKIRNLAYKITESCVTDMEKTKAIHDWVSSNIDYDVEASNNDNIHEYSAIETFEGKKAVCNGYANLTAALNRIVGIKCKIISGTVKNSIFDKSSENNNHAWNQTYIDGKWISQDTTWDASRISILTNKFRFKLSHKYFNPSPKAFARTHKKIIEK